MPGLCTINGDPFYLGPNGGKGSWLAPKVPNAVLDLILPPTDSVVTLAEVKADNKIDGSDEDAYITDLINLCQAHIEQYCGISLNERTVQAILCNVEGNIRIPFGPVISITSMVDQDGNDLKVNSVIRGLTYQWIQSPYSAYINITYQAGYTSDILPQDLKKAVKQEIAFRYRYRVPGTDLRKGVNAGICEEAMTYANPYRQNKFL